MRQMIFSISTKYRDLGIRGKKTLELMSDVEITSKSIYIERRPNKAEQGQIWHEQSRKKEEECRKTE